MKKKFHRVLICSLFFGCDHPEFKKYERNQGEHKKSESGVETEMNLSEANLPENTNYKNRNVLQMEVENGVRYIWIEIIGIRLRFIFDTGASSICISPVEASVLYRQGTLKKEDVLNIEYFQDATGRISEGTKINLREVKIGSMILQNVKATVVDKINAPLLLGQSVLERFGSIEIDNQNREIIFK